MGVDLSRLCVSPEAPVRQAIACIDGNGQGIALVVDPERRLLGTLTDGDVRRAILGGLDLDLPVKDLLERRPPAVPRHPVTALAEASDASLLHLMNQNGLRHIPLLDQEGRVIDVALLSELAKEYELPLRAVVMAGGYGTRLRPLTEEVPKPMLPMGDRPLLEWTIQQLRQAGIRRVHLATHYRKEVISEHFRDGSDFGVEIRYLEEDRPLGTAGALGLLDQGEGPLLVVNGDVLSRVDYRALFEFHQEQQAEMTVAVRVYEQQVPYGVLQTDGVRVTGITEKPAMRYLINAGIYLVGPEACRLVSPGQSLDMPDLIRLLLDQGRRVVSFPVHEYWVDIGQMADYQKAQADFEKKEA